MAAHIEFPGSALAPMEADAAAGADPLRHRAHAVALHHDVGGEPPVGDEEYLRQARHGLVDAPHRPLGRDHGHKKQVHAVKVPVDQMRGSAEKKRKVFRSDTLTVNILAAHLLLHYLMRMEKSSHLQLLCQYIKTDHCLLI